MSATVAVSSSHTATSRASWTQDLVIGLLPLLLGFQVLLTTVYVPLALQGLADFRQLYTGGHMIRTGFSMVANRNANAAERKSEPQCMVPS